MKTLILTSILFSSFLFMSTSANTIAPKQLKPIHKSTVELNLGQFCNYLENGSPHEVEGIYTSPDGRYVIALVKNDETQHDFIGVVVAADNNYWSKGQVKFNFVLNDSNLLKGYYYDSRGDYVPINFSIDSDSLETNKLKKMSLEAMKASTMAYLTEK